MSVTSNTYIGQPGGYTITDSDLAYTQVLRVQRSGVEYNIIFSGTPNSRQVKYSANEGKLTFVAAFTGNYGVSVGSVTPTDILEDIIVTYNL